MLRLSDFDYLTATTDTPANARYEGLLNTQDFAVSQTLGFWPWGDAPLQAAGATIPIYAGSGRLDDAIALDLTGEHIDIRLGREDGTLASATPVARFRGDRIVIDGDSRAELRMLDAHPELDDPLNPQRFAASIAQLADQPQPCVLGAVANIPVQLTGSDGSVGYVGDAAVHLANVRDRGDALETGTFSRDAANRQVLFNSPPLGPVTGDGSSLGVTGGEPVPLTLQQMLQALYNRSGTTCWTTADAAAIDTATGYAGIGYYTAAQPRVREVLPAVLSSYGAGLWQDATGSLRTTRVVDPAPLPIALEIDQASILGDVRRRVDEAPGLTRRMAWRPNARVLSESDLVTDMIDVPAPLRERLTAPWHGVAYSALPLAQRYAHADNAPPMVSLFWRLVDAQAEIDRICALYQLVRYFYAVRCQVSAAPLPGTACRLTYTRHGLSAGRKLLIRSVRYFPTRGEAELELWG